MKILGIFGTVSGAICIAPVPVTQNLGFIHIHVVAYPKRPSLGSEPYRVVSA